MSLEPGHLIDGKYRIVRLIGEGGMGAVYEGENVRISRRVAIKVLHAGYTENKEVVQRFEREAQAAGRIGNDHILEVLDLGTLANGDHFIVMEFLDGEPLSSRIKHLGRLDPATLAPLIRQVLVGLAAAHQAGIYHRDLKPDNLFVLREKAGKPDFVKIIDFGISKFQPLGNDGMKMTRTGAVMGTPYYMSPEQASGSQEADHRSDLYSVGVIMFEAVTGQVPFEAATFNQLMFKIVLEDVPRPESIVPELDPAFASIVSKAMARDVTQRFQTAQDFTKAIDGWLATGSAVTVPPTADPAAAALLPPGARTALQAARKTAPVGPGTAGSWETSQPVEQLPLNKGPSGALIAAVATVLLLVGGGVAYAVFGGRSESSPAAEVPEAPSSSAGPAAVAAPVPPPAEPEPAPVTPPPSSSASPEPAPASDSEKVKSPSEPAPKPVRPVSRSKPRAEPKPAGKPTKSGGSVDFGY